MKALEVFNLNGTDIRVREENGEIIFVSKDLATVLGYSDTYAMTRYLDDDEKGASIWRTLGGEQKLSHVTEPGMWAALTRSTHPDTKAIRRKINHDILPQIRKTGSYGAPQVPDLSSLGADTLAYLAQLNQGMQLAIESAQKNQQKADGYDKFLNAKGLYLPSAVAKMLGIKQKEFFQFLYDQRILIPGVVKHHLPYSTVPRSWVEVKTYDPSRTGGYARCQSFFTPYGVEQLRLLAIKHGVIAPQLLVLPAGATA